jgi:hypothetical protein
LEGLFLEIGTGSHSLERTLNAWGKKAKIENGIISN